MDGTKVVLVKAPDWQMLYVNGKLEVQEERLMADQVLTLMLQNNWLYGVQFEVKEVDYDWYELQTTDLPKDIKDVKFSSQT